MAGDRSQKSIFLKNIIFGIISTPQHRIPQPAIAIGGQALDLQKFALEGGFKKLLEFSPEQGVFAESTLNAFAALGRPIHRPVRHYIQEIFTKGG